ncbi:MAG: hypothetical protein GC131_03665 [Alphaproteobacteria bacterium]|nr:hypothetical protein [Alphaproteobacteria bacterium]
MEIVGANDAGTDLERLVYRTDFLDDGGVRIDGLKAQDLKLVVRKTQSDIRFQFINVADHIVAEKKIPFTDIRKEMRAYRAVVTQTHQLGRDTPPYEIEALHARRSQIHVAGTDRMLELFGPDVQWRRGSEKGSPARSLFYLCTHGLT